MEIAQRLVIVGVGGLVVLVEGCEEWPQGESGGVLPRHAEILNCT
jgi:hypothetical protein